MFGILNFEADLFFLENQTLLIHFQSMLSFEFNLLIYIYFVVISLKYCPNDTPQLEFPRFKFFKDTFIIIFNNLLHIYFSLTSKFTCDIFLFSPEE